MSFFYITGVNDYVEVILFVFWLLAVYALFSSLFFLVKEAIRENDELARKIVVESFAVAFTLIILLHVVQMVIRVVYFYKTGQDINLVVTPGLNIVGLGDTGLHLESFGVDLGILAICLIVNRLRYRI